MVKEEADAEVSINVTPPENVTFLPPVPYQHQSRRGSMQQNELRELVVNFSLSSPPFVYNSINIHFLSSFKIHTGIPN